MKAGHNQSRIAIVVGCHKSTISRELRRNRGLKGYRPYQADELAYDRQCAAYRSRIAWQTWQEVERLLCQEWSPEQIAGRLKLEQQPTVSHECIYLPPPVRKGLPFRTFINLLRGYASWRWRRSLLSQ